MPAVLVALVNGNMAFRGFYMYKLTETTFVQMGDALKHLARGFHKGFVSTIELRRAPRS